MPAVDIAPQKQWIDNIETFDALKNADLPDPEWFIKNILPKPGLVAITGKPGSYKTWFVQWMLTRMAYGKALFDRYPEEGCWFTHNPQRRVSVLFIEEEMSRRQIRKRLVETKSFGDCENFYWNVSGGFDVQNPKIMQELKELIIKRQIEIIVFDPFTSCTKMRDENDNAEARIVMDIIRHELVDSELECTVIFIHHPAKGDQDAKSIRGAGDILGKCDMHFTLEIKERAIDYAKIEIECGKSRYEPVDTFYAIMEKDYQDTFQRLIWQFGGVKQKEKEDEKGDEFRVLKKYLELHPTVGRKECAELISLNVTGTRFRKIWDELTK